MGFWDKVGDLLKTPLNAGKDLVTLPFDIATDLPDLVTQGPGTFLSEATHDAINHGENLIQDVFGPKGYLGAAFNIVPNAIRTPIREVAAPIQSGMNTAYHDVIAHPAAALITALDIAGNRDTGTHMPWTGWGNLFDSTVWSQAWKLSQHRTPGQAVFLAATTDNLDDPAQVAKAMHSDWYHVVSGLIDAPIRWELDPSNLLGAAFQYHKAAFGASFAPEGAVYGWAKGGRAGYNNAVANALESPGTTTVFDKINQYMREGESFPNVAKTASQEEKSAAVQAALSGNHAVGDAYVVGRIRDRFMPNVSFGDKLSGYLASSAKSEDTFKAMLGAMYGHGPSLDKLAALDPALASDYIWWVRKTRGMDELAGTAMGDAIDSSLLNDPASFGAGATATIADARVSGAIPARLNYALRPTIPGAIREALGSTHWYRDTLTGRAIGTFFNNTAPAVIAFDHPESSETFQRWMRSSKVYSTDEEMALRGEYIMGSPAQRAALLRRTGSQITGRLADEFNVPASQVPRLQRHAIRELQDSPRKLADAHMMFGTDGRGVATVADDGTILANPVFPDTQAVNVSGLTPWGNVRDALGTWARLKGNHPALAYATELPHAIADMATSAFRISMIMRPATAARVMIDTEARMLANIHSAADLFNLIRMQAEGSKNYLTSMNDTILGVKGGEIRGVAPRAAQQAGIEALGEAGGEGGRAVAAANQATAEATAKIRALRRGAFVGGAVGAAVGGPPGAILGAAAGGGLARAFTTFAHYGYRDLMYDGTQIGSGLGDTADTQALIRTFISARPEASAWARAQDGASSTFSTLRKSFDIISPADATHGAAWEHYVNNFIGKSIYGRKILAGWDADRLAHWMIDTPVGRQGLASMPVRSGLTPTLEQATKWAQDMIDQTYALTAGDPVIHAAALRSEATASMLDDQLRAGTITTKPNVAGAVVEHAYGKGSIAKFAKSAIDNVTKFMYSAPVDYLLREPNYRYLYRQNMMRQLDSFRLADGTLPPIHEADLNAMKLTASRQSIKGTQQIMHEFADRSEFSQMIRTMIPFFGAHQEMISKWIGIAVQHPDYMNKLRLAYEGIQSLPRVDPTDTNPPPSPIFRTKDSYGNDVVRMVIPDFAKGLLGHLGLTNAVDDQGYISFDPKSISMVLQPPGFGPIVQLAAAAMIKDRPDLESTLKFVLPFGTPHGVLDAFTPAWVKRFETINGNQEDRSSAAARLRIIETKLTKMASGETPMMDFTDPQQLTTFLDSVTNETRQLTMLRTASSFFSPMPLTFTSPYEPYIAQYRKLLAADPATADAKFLDTYGPEFFALTSHVTRNLTGLPSTLEGYNTERNFGDLVQAYPGFGGLIMGKSGGGTLAQFSSAVYEHQLATKLPSGETERQLLSPKDMVEEPNRRQGWIAFSRTMDLVDALLAERGLRSINVKAAAPIAAFKQAKIAQLAQQYPAWFADYMASDSLATQRRIQDLTAIANDPRMAGRDDMIGLRRYLIVRQHVVDVLAARKSAGGSGTLTANANADLAAGWDAVVQQIRLDNTAFSDLHARWLSHDLPAVSIADRVAA